MSLAKVRKEKGFTQAQLAEASDINVRTIQKYESRERQIEGAKLSILVDLALTLDCRVSDIIEDTKLIAKCKKMGI